MPNIIHKINDKRGLIPLLINRQKKSLTLNDFWGYYHPLRRPKNQMVGGDAKTIKTRAKNYRK